MISCPVVKPVVVARADGYATVGEIKSAAKMQTGTSVDVFASAKGVHHFLLGYFPRGHIGVQATERKIQQVLDGTLSVTYRRGGGRCLRRHPAACCPPRGGRASIASALRIGRRW